MTREQAMTVLRRIAAKLDRTADILLAGWRGSERVDGIDIFGRLEFRRAVTDALRLLRDARLPAGDTLARHVDSILEGRSAAVVVTAHPAFMFVGGLHTAQGSGYLAAALAHMACSVQLHRDFEAERPGRRVPRDVYRGSAARERCEKAYRECLQALGISADGATAGTGASS